ncbi:MAG: hypothetical protein H6737_27440 [Alphaproteobacteria bacterium]|nr:hypothetical protein [Alphaproteobacteria bacterium]
MTLLFLLFSCDLAAIGTYEVCDLDLSPAPAAADPGDTVVITGGPLSAQHDLLVTIAGLRAEVLDMQREGCGECDTCLAENGCLACGTCLPCTETCSTCVETTTIVVPDAPQGDTRLTMVNVFGTGVTAFRVGGLHTGATGDTGVPTATADTGVPPGPTGDTAAPGPTGDTAAPETAAPVDTAAPPTTADTGGSPPDTGSVVPSDTSPTGDTAIAPSDTGASTGGTAHTGSP